ncbi:MAG: hypothetical protein J7L77_04195, partial [Clostridiales bacterium]|nr:hypothetical protein [Clostridiales bacterium]
MKKALVMILILAVALAPAVVFSHDALSAKELYLNADTLLSDYIDTYADLLESRDDDICKYENMRINRKNSFNLAKSMASKENNILQIDFNIENRYDSIKSREAQLVIEFRTSYLNLYTLQKSAEDEKVEAMLKTKEYEAAKKGNNSGYVSESELLQLEYTTMALNNEALNKERQYESALRHFNYKIGYPLDYNEYQFDFNESILEPLALDFYIDNALKNTSAIKLIQQRLEKYYIEQKHYDVYAFSTNLSYISDALRDLKINTRIQELQLEKTKIIILTLVFVLAGSVVLGLTLVNLTQQEAYDAAVKNNIQFDIDELNLELKQIAYDKTLKAGSIPAINNYYGQLTKYYNPYISETTLITEKAKSEKAYKQLEIDVVAAAISLENSASSYDEVDLALSEATQTYNDAVKNSETTSADELSLKYSMESLKISLHQAQNNLDSAQHKLDELVGMEGTAVQLPSEYSNPYDISPEKAYESALVIDITIYQSKRNDEAAAIKFEIAERFYDEDEDTYISALAGLKSADLSYDKALV